MNPMSKILADRFISAYKPIYGLDGINTQTNPSRGFPKYSWQNELFTRNNWMQFGYNGHPWTWRDSSTCAFYTNYANSIFKHRSLEEEIDNALREISARFDEVAVHQSNDPGEHLLMEGLKRTGIPHQIVSWNGSGWDPEWIREFGGAVRCNDPMQAVRAAVGLQTDLPVIYSGGGIRLTNIDQYVKDAKPYWSLEDQEQDYAIHRWLIATGRTGVPNFWKWSPELMGAVIDEFFNENPEQFLPVRPRDYPMVEITKHDKCNERWYTPMHRLQSILKTDRVFERPANYGDVL